MSAVAVMMIVVAVGCLIVGDLQSRLHSCSAGPQFTYIFYGSL